MPLWTTLRATIGRSMASPDAETDQFSALERFFFVNPLQSVYSKVRQPDGTGILERLLREMRIQVRVAPEDLTRIPLTGALLVVANHPFGILDGAVLGALLTRLRKDVKMLTNYLAGAVEELKDLCIYVDPFARPASHRLNVAAFRQAVLHLKRGGLLAMFPAGEVSHWQFRHGEVTDPEWSPAAARLAGLTGAPVVPVLFSGRNSVSYHMLGMVHPRLRTVQLPREFLNKAGKEIELRIGTPVLAEKLARIGNEQQATNYLRWRTYLLARRERVPELPPPAPHKQDI